jgi:hypothetical protein
MSHRRLAKARSAALAAMLITIAGSFSLAVPADGAAPGLVVSGPGTYVPLNPARIADTRAASGFPDAGQTLGQASTVNVQVSGVGGVPSTAVSSVVLNVTAVNPTAASFFTVYPEGTTQPVVANLNFTEGETLANLVTTSVGTGGAISIFNHAGRVDVVVDVEGYYTSSPEESGLYDPVNPIRVFGNADVGGTIGAGVTQSVPVVGGSTGVPTGVSAVVANVTAADPSTAGFLTVYPTPSSPTEAPPTSANVNFTKGQIVGNRVIVPVGADGSIDIFNHSGTVSVDVDLFGYFTGTSGQLGSAFTALSPVRFTDTRVGVNSSTLGPRSTETFTFSSEGIPGASTSLASNISVVSGSSTGFLTVFPSNEAATPIVGDVNFQANSVEQTFSLAPLEAGSVKIFNSSASPVNIVIDAFGYFSPPPPEVRVVASPTSLPADGQSQVSITVTVTTGSGVAFDDPVSLSATPSVPGSCGIASATGSTNASGQVISTYTASVTPGTCTVTATEANGGTTGSVVLTQTAT